MSSRNIFFRGLKIVVRNWPAIVWTYVFNLGLAFLFSVPLHAQLAALTANSLASQRLTSGFDLAVVIDVSRTLAKGPGSAASASYLSTPIFLLLYFFLVPGTLFCYQTGAAPKLSTLLQTGFAYFWRFVRLTLISFVVFALILGPLMALQNHWSSHVDVHEVGRIAFLHEFAGVVILGLVAAALRLYFDLTEVYTVQLGSQLRQSKSGELIPDRRVRRTLLPAWRLLRRHFLRAYIAFAALTIFGLSAVIVTARIALHTLAQPRVWPAFVLVQIGLFIQLAVRFWQRGAETALALDFPLPAPVIAPVAPVPEFVVTSALPLES